jgi:hypothetical protein
VLAVGGSETLGVQCYPRPTADVLADIEMHWSHCAWPARLERWLAAFPGAAVEVLNLGQGGTTITTALAHAPLWLGAEAHRDADLVVFDYVRGRGGRRRGEGGGRVVSPTRAPPSSRFATALCAHTQMVNDAYDGLGTVGAVGATSVAAAYEALVVLTRALLPAAGLLFFNTCGWHPRCGPAKRGGGGCGRPPPRRPGLPYVDVLTLSRDLAGNGMSEEDWGQRYWGEKSHPSWVVHEMLARTLV